MLPHKPNILFHLQVKKFHRLRQLPKFDVKFNFSRSYNRKLYLDYLDYPVVILWIFWTIFKTGIFFGLGVHGYYTLDLSKKQKFGGRADYFSKLQIKKDSRFFYGVVLTRHLNFLSSTLKIRNVFYNEIMEKTLPLFSIRNTLVSELPRAGVKHFLAPYISRIKKWKKFFYLWNYPRAECKITLK